MLSCIRRGMTPRGTRSHLAAPSVSLSKNATIRSHPPPPILLRCSLPPLRAFSTADDRPSSMLKQRKRYSFRTLPHELPAPRDPHDRLFPRDSSDPPSTRTPPPMQIEMARLVDAHDWNAAFELEKKLIHTSLAGHAQTIRILLEALLMDGQVQRALSSVDVFLRANPDQYASTSVIRALIRAEQIDAALKVFRRISRPDAIVTSVLALGFIQQGRLSDASRLILDTEKARLWIGVPVYRALLSGFLRNSMKEEATEFIKASKSTRLSHCADLIARLGGTQEAEQAAATLARPKNRVPNSGKRIVGAMVQFAKRGKISELLRILEQIPADDSETLANARAVTLDAYTTLHQLTEARDFMTKVKDGPMSMWLLQAILKYYVAIGDVRTAASYLDETLAREQLLTHVSVYNVVLHGWVKIRNWREAEALFASMPSRGVAPDMITYSCLLHGYCAEGYLDKAEKLITEMRANPNAQPTPSLWGRLIGVLARTNVDAALKRLAMLEAEGVFQPQPDVYDACLPAIAKKNLDAAIAMKNRLLQGPHKPTELTYMILVHAQTDAQAAETLCNEMRGLSLPFDAVLCKHMERLWRNAENPDMVAQWEALRYQLGVPIAKGSEDPPSPAVLLLRKAVTALAMNKLDEMRAHVRELRTANSKPSDYTEIARRVSRKLPSAEAVDIIRWLISECAAKHAKLTELWNVLLDILVVARQVSEVNAIIQEMLEAGVQPNETTYALQLTALGRANKIAEAEELFYSLPQRGITPSLESINSLLLAHAVNGDLKRMQKLLNYMKELGVKGDVTTRGTEVVGQVMAGDLKGALALIDKYGTIASAYGYHVLIKALEKPGDARPELIAKLKQRKIQVQRRMATAQKETSYMALRHALDF